jgi:hypothetical protein
LIQIYLCKAKYKNKNKAKVHPPDRIKKNLKKSSTLEANMSVVGVNRVEMLVLLLPHDRQREFLVWDVQIGPVILGGSIDCRLVGSCCMS